MSNIVREMLKDYYNLDDGSKIDIDGAINHLVAKEAFSPDDLIILRLTMEGQTSGNVGKAVGLTSSQVNRRLIDIASKVASCLGEEYQDSKILKEVETRLGRPLTPEEELFCWKVIKTGHPLRKGLNIFNFKVGKDGFIIGDESKTKR